MSESASQPSPAEALFRDTQTRFSSRAALLSTFSSWQALFGVNDRIGGRRVGVLRGTARAKFLIPELGELSDRDMRAFMGLALVNKEQAEAAFRFTAIVNFTVPLSFLLLLNQSIEGGLAAMLANASAGSFWLVVSVTTIAALSVFYLISLSQFGVQFARDIYHLALIEESRRDGVDRPPSASDDADILNPTDL